MVDGRSAVVIHSGYSNVLSVTPAYDYTSTKASGEDDPVLLHMLEVTGTIGANHDER